MIRKYIPPNKLLHCKNYAEMCDFSFMRTDSESFAFIPPNQMSDIRSNSTIYCWSSRLNELFLYLYHNTQKIQNVVVISGDNDHPCNPNGTVIGWPQYSKDGIIPSPPNVVRWFAQNAEVDNSLMVPFSIGVAKYHTDEGGKQYEVTVDDYRKMMEDHKRNKLIYFCCNVKNNINTRLFAGRAIFEKCSSAASMPKRESQLDYFRSLQEHLFVACPPGNGKDTHRIWESLYFGAIPIVEDSVMNRHFAQLFPILIVDTWNQITPTFLLEKYKEFSNKEWRYDLLDAENYFRHYGISTRMKQTA